MDTSEQYIEMCERATEIQEGKSQDGVSGVFVAAMVLIATFPDDGIGNYYHVQDEITSGTCKCCGQPTEESRTVKTTWLPRQDQLQEMVKIGTMRIMQFDEEYSLEYWKTQYFPENMESPNYEYCGKTLEFCWLHLVMQINYNKTWNGKEWVIV